MLDKSSTNPVARPPVLLEVFHEVSGVEFLVFEEGLQGRREIFFRLHRHEQCPKLAIQLLCQLRALLTRPRQLRSQLL